LVYDRALGAIGDGNACGLFLRRGDHAVAYNLGVSLIVVCEDVRCMDIAQAVSGAGIRVDGDIHCPATLLKVSFRDNATHTGAGPPYPDIVR
jgi:hypothetical protein